jgi:hypothetical protein
VRQLTTHEIDIKNQYNAKLSSNDTTGLKLGSYWKEIGIRCTFIVANGRHKKKCIQSLVQDEAKIEGQSVEVVHYILL